MKCINRNLLNNYGLFLILTRLRTGPNLETCTSSQESSAQEVSEQDSLERPICSFIASDFFARIATGKGAEVPDLNNTIAISLSDN